MQDRTSLLVLGAGEYKMAMLKMWNIFLKLSVVLVSIAFQFGYCPFTPAALPPMLTTVHTKGIVVLGDDVILMRHPGCVDNSIAFGSLKKDHKCWLFQELSKRGRICTIVQAPDKTIWCLLDTWFGSNLITISPIDRQLIPIPLPYMHAGEHIICLAALDKGPILLTKDHIYSLNKVQWHCCSWQCLSYYRSNGGAPLDFSTNGGAVVVIPHADYVLIGTYFDGFSSGQTTNWYCVNIQSGRTRALKTKYDEDLSPSATLKKMDVGHCWFCDKIAINGNVMWCTARNGCMSRVSTDGIELLFIKWKDIVDDATWGPGEVGDRIIDHPMNYHDLIKSITALAVDFDGVPWIISRGSVFKLGTDGKFFKLLNISPNAESLRFLDKSKIIIGHAIKSEQDLKAIYGLGWWFPWSPVQERARFSIVSQDNHGNWVQNTMSCPDSLYLDPLAAHY